VTKKKGWLFVLPWSPEVVGGVSIVVSELCKAMNINGQYKPYIMVEDWSAKNPIVVDKDDYTEIRYRLRNCSTQFDREFISFIMYLPSTIFTLRKICKRYNIQVLNPHYPSLSSVNFALFKLVMKKVNFIISFHGSDLSDIMKKKGFKIWDFIFNYADRVISCSKGMSERVITVFPQISNKSDHIHNGVSPTLFNVSQQSSTYDGQILPCDYILLVGTFEHQKGQDILLKAFALITEQFSELTLILVGRTSSELFRCKKLATELKIEDKVFFYENIAPKSIATFYRGAKIYVSASRQEAFGMVILEAAAFKVPVIATKTIGACEIIDDNVDGKLIDIEDTKAMAEQITLLLTDEKECQRLANALYQKAKYDFTWEKALKKYESFVQ
tara:strand:+ start:9516 stop:10673 length:1158 start_codon:yes stop_codon:yes gene_type:complete